LGKRTGKYFSCRGYAEKKGSKLIDLRNEKKSYVGTQGQNGAELKKLSSTPFRIGGRDASIVGSSKGDKKIGRAGSKRRGRGNRRKQDRENDHRPRRPRQKKTAGVGGALDLGTGMGGAPVNCYQNHD